MSARACNISAELDLAGVNVQVLDYRWNVNETVSHLEDRFILRYRPFPASVSLSARLGADVQDFGQLMFFPARLETRTTPARASERTRNVMCSFTEEWFRRIWPDTPDWDRRRLSQCMNLQNSRIEQAMQKLAVEAASPGFASNLLAESIAQFIAVEIARHFNPQQYSGRVRTVEGQLSAKDLSRIYDFIDSITNKSVTTDEIARKCGISPAHLRRSFKRTTGLTLHQYVADARLSKAQTLLRETDLPLKEISFRLGFECSSTFSTTFKKTSGETPSCYRRRYQEAPVPYDTRAMIRHNATSGQRRSKVIQS